MLCWIVVSEATIIGPQQSDFWASHPIEAFHGAPLCLGCWISRNHFDVILQVLSFTDLDPPNYVDKFWKVQQMLKAWGSNMYAWVGKLSGLEYEHLDEQILLSRLHVCPKEAVAIWE